MENRTKNAFQKKPIITQFQIILTKTNHENKFIAYIHFDIMYNLSIIKHVSWKKGFCVNCNITNEGNYFDEQTCNLITMLF